ncbi:DNA packaging protein [Pseudoxanthomonas sp. X-1]|uniref:terminase small subunit-like protein n=1 Tax=Pseudoxanthomonas sp. X-1 TaxID=2571115 RepID=UPI00110A5DB3|nr:DNA packaging protein [Pseudoxanthomonas sp. X-1]TMN24510.1 DNA packaging protein [Pseudoxanthomonas sp. X-1]UAY75224.1 hypothetical protein LAJ50_02870 [Pseudoxanthomonas sp. X-1]
MEAKKTKDAAVAKKGGKPSLYSPEVVEAIAARLSQGEPMAVICRDEGMPAYRTVKDWMDSRSDVAALIALARVEGFDSLAAECLEIADDSRNDWMERAADGGDEVALQFNGEHVQRSKLRIETRLKLLAKWDPKRYGERLALDHDVVGNLADRLQAARKRADGG